MLADLFDDHGIPQEVLGSTDREQHVIRLPEGGSGWAKHGHDGLPELQCRGDAPRLDRRSLREDRARSFVKRKKAASLSPERSRYQGASHSDERIQKETTRQHSHQNPNATPTIKAFAVFSFA